MGISQVGDQLEGLDMAGRINADNDKVEVFRGDDGDWYWHRKDADNGRVVAISGEGYTSREYAVESAQTYCPGLDVTTIIS